MFLGGLLLCCSSWIMAQQTIEADTLAKVEAPVDSLVAVAADSVLLAQADSVVAENVVDSTAIALRPLTQLDVDSTKLVLEQVKALTDRISEQSLLNAHLVKEVFSDTAVVNKYNRLLDKMVVQYAAEVENIQLMSIRFTSVCLLRLLFTNHR